MARLKHTVLERVSKEFKLRAAPNVVPRTLLDELDKVKRHFNQELPLSDWLGIRVYEPEHRESGEILWHLRKNPLDKMQDIVMIGYTCMKDIHSWSKISRSWQSFMHVLIVKRAAHKLITCNNMLTKTHAHKEGQLLISQLNGLKLSRQLIRELSTTTRKPRLQHHRSTGLSTQARH